MISRTYFAHIVVMDTDGSEKAVCWRVRQHRSLFPKPVQLIKEILVELENHYQTKDLLVKEFNRL